MKPRILLVDDEPMIRRTLARALASKFEVTVASDGVTAIAILETAEFDAVMTDLEMPNLGGDGLVAWLELHRPTLAKKAVVLTGGASTGARAVWLSHFDKARILLKPCTIDVLTASLQRACRRGDE